MPDSDLGKVSRQLFRLKDAEVRDLLAQQDKTGILVAVIGQLALA